MKFATFRRNFDEILPEFHRNVQEMKNCLDILRKSARKIRKMLEISGICEETSFFISLLQSSPHCTASGTASWIASWTAPRTASCAAVRNVCESDSLARRRAGTRPYHFGSPGAAPRQTFFFSFSQSFRFLSPSPIFACFSFRLQQFLFLFSTVWVEISIFHETCLCVLTKNR